MVDHVKVWEMEHWLEVVAMGVHRSITRLCQRSMIDFKILSIFMGLRYFVAFWVMYRVGYMFNARVLCVLKGWLRYKKVSAFGWHSDVGFFEVLDVDVKDNMALDDKTTNQGLLAHIQSWWRWMPIAQDHDSINSQVHKKLVPPLESMSSN